MSALVHNPLISFKLLIPLILEKQKNGFKNENESNIINIAEKKSEISGDSALGTNSKIKNIKKINSSYNRNRKSKSKDKNKEEIFEIKDERQMMEKEQRQIFNLFEESDDIDAEELQTIAPIVLDRINNKLIGTDFYNGMQLNEKEQVDTLIKEARSPENLATSYLGWEPFL